MIGNRNEYRQVFLYMARNENIILALFNKLLFTSRPVLLFIQFRCNDD